MSMGQWLLKGCPRCNGDLHLEKDMDGAWTAICLQCSYSRDLKRAHSEEEIRTREAQLKAGRKFSRDVYYNSGGF